MYVEWIFYDTLKILPFLRDISNSLSKKLEIRTCRNCILLNKSCRKNGCFKFYSTAKNHSSLHPLIKVLVTFFFVVYIKSYLSLRWRYTAFYRWYIYQYLLSLSRSISLFNFTPFYFHVILFFLLQFNIS